MLSYYQQSTDSRLINIVKFVTEQQNRAHSFIMSSLYRYTAKCFVHNRIIYKGRWYTVGEYLTLGRLCCLVVSVPGYRSRGPGFCSLRHQFSEKWWVWNGVHSVSWGQWRSCLKEKVAAPVYIMENNGRWNPFRDTAPPAKVVNNFAGPAMGLIRLRTKSHGPFFVFVPGKQKY
jgi:hypothetical protein